MNDWPHLVNAGLGVFLLFMSHYAQEGARRNIVQATCAIIIVGSLLRFFW